MNACLPLSLAAALAIAAIAAHGHTIPPQTARAADRHALVLNAAAMTHTLTPASKPATPPAGRGSKPLHAVNGAGPGQAGYVHYFLIRLPDDTLEVQLGIELADQRIAWSFPGLGVAISPFIEAGDIAAGNQTYEVWHLYGLRPLPDYAAMARLRKALPGRIEPWLQAGTPYCLNDGPNSNCMSCLGFVLRALFPGRSSDYPALPRDFSRTTNPAQYTPNDLLLYLSGMLDLPDRNSRLQRIARLKLPEDLREDLEELVRMMGDSAATAPLHAVVPLTARQKNTGSNPAPSIKPQLPRRKP